MIGKAFDQHDALEVVDLGVDQHGRLQRRQLLGFNADGLGADVEYDGGLADLPACRVFDQADAEEGITQGEAVVFHACFPTFR